MEPELPRSRRRWTAAVAAAVLIGGTATAAVTFPRAPSAPPDSNSWAERTGVPEGTRLTVIPGDIEVTAAGAVLEALDVRGRIIVSAPDVTIRYSVIRGAPAGTRGALVDAMAGHPNLTIVDSEIFADTPSPSVNGVMGSGFTLRRVDIHNVVDQVHIVGDDVTVADSWLHGNLHYPNDPNRNGEPSHDDNVQVQEGAGIRIVRNRLSDAHNAVLMITQDSGAVKDLRFEYNGVDGGSCSINVSQGDRGPIQGLVLRHNVFGRSMTIDDCAVIAPSTTTLRLSGNRFEDGGKVSVRKGG